MPPGLQSAYLFVRFAEEDEIESGDDEWGHEDHQPDRVREKRPESRPTQDQRDADPKDRRDRDRKPIDPPRSHDRSVPRPAGTTCVERRVVGR
jgi:hypothetical protein